MRKQIKTRVRYSILERDDFTCQYCGAQAPDVKLHVDHIISVADGGKNNIDNLITACQDCNLGKTGKSLGFGGLPVVDRYSILAKDIMDFGEFVRQYKLPPERVYHSHDRERVRQDLAVWGPGPLSYRVIDIDGDYVKNRKVVTEFVRLNENPDLFCMGCHKTYKIKKMRTISNNEVVCWRCHLNMFK